AVSRISPASDPPVSVSRSATHGSGVALVSAAVQAGTGVPFRNSTIEAAVSPAGIAVASIVNTSTSGATWDATGAVIATSDPKNPYFAGDVPQIACSVIVTPAG